MPIGTRTDIGRHWQGGLTLLLGIWLFVAPWGAGYVGVPAAAWNSWIFGVVITVISVAALVQFALWEEWLNVVLGVWLLISPWILGFAQTGDSRAVWNHVLVGVAVGVLALWDALTHREPPRVSA